MKLLEIAQIATDEEVESVHKTIGMNIKRLRRERGVSQLELALIIGQTSAAFFANAENYAKGRHFNVEHLYKISKALEITICDLFIQSSDSP